MIIYSFQAGLDDFVENLFNPVLSMQHSQSVDDLTDPDQVNQALKGGGKGPRPPSPIPGRENFAANSEYHGENSDVAYLTIAR